MRNDYLGRRVWTRDEIEHILYGVCVAHLGAARHLPDAASDGYHQGFLAATHALAAALGILDPSTAAIVRFQNPDEEGRP